MNYFGHAVVAFLRRPEPAFVLGAMVPDFAAMLRLAQPSPTHAGVAAGVAFHHETDGRFHHAPTFVELNHAALSALRERDVARGPARAAAHIGTELLIDGMLCRSAEWVAGYVAALEEVARDGALLEGIPDAARPELAALAAHLAERGAAVHATSRERLEFRLGRSLAGRRRIEPGPGELEVILDTLLARCAAVEERVPALLLELSPLWS
jgi:hypothetical protein